MKLADDVLKALGFCLLSTKKSGEWWFQEVGLATGETEEFPYEGQNAEPGEMDKDYLWIRPPETMGIARSDDRKIYYYVEDRELFFNALAEVHGHDAITEYLLSLEES